MKKFLFIVLISLFCANFALAQTATPEPENWSNFAPEDEEFSIDAPITLYLRDYSGIDKKNLSRRYRNSLNGTYFYIFSDETKNQYQIEAVADFVKLYKSSSTAGTIGEVETNLLAFTDNAEFHYTILTIRGKNRVYVFQTVSPTADNPLVGRFFNSLRFNGAAAEKKLIEPKNEKEITVSIPLLNIEKKQIADQTGRGRGQGIETKPPTPINLPTPLKLLSKPRANYTDAARFYEMEGRVAVRVTFSANGQIGAISVVSKLPFGLTEQAIAAARQIGFEPGAKDGTPVSITKTVEYSFTIY